jgi:hypothetical protein
MASPTSSSIWKIIASLFVCVRFAGEPFVQDGNPQQRFAIQNRNGHLCPQQLKLFLYIPAVLRVVTARAQNSTLPMQVSTDTGSEL